MNIILKKIKIPFLLLSLVVLAVYAWAGANVTGTFSPLTLNGINWLDIHNIGGTNINWTDIKVYATGFGGDHSNINWQSLGV